MSKQNNMLLYAAIGVGAILFLKKKNTPVQTIPGGVNSSPLGTQPVLNPVQNSSGNSSLLTTATNILNNIFGGGSTQSNQPPISIPSTGQNSINQLPDATVTAPPLPTPAPVQQWFNNPDLTSVNNNYMEDMMYKQYQDQIMQSNGYDPTYG